MHRLIQIIGFIPSKGSGRRDIRRSVWPRFLAYSVSFLLLVGCGAIHTPTGEADSPAPATHTPTLTPTLTLDSDTFTKTPNPIVFDPVNFSSDMLWQGGESCGLKTLTVQVKVSPPEWVFSVGLFYRVVEKEGAGAYPWSTGLAMIPQGNGWYQLVLAGDDLPDTFMWEHQAWLDMQFAANDNDGQVIALSQVFRNVTLGQCYV